MPRQDNQTNKILKYEWQGEVRFGIIRDATSLSQRSRQFREREDRAVGRDRSWAPVAETFTVTLLAACNETARSPARVSQEGRGSSMRELFRLKPD